MILRIAEKTNNNLMSRVNFMAAISLSRKLYNVAIITQKICDTNHKLKKLTFAILSVYNHVMKKIILGLMVVSVFALAGCGVKSDLVRPNSSFPRNYPVY